MTTTALDVLGGSTTAGSTSTDVMTGVSGSGGYKSPCRAATTGNVALTGLSAIDGVTPVAGDRILVWQQTNPVENGIYNASAGAWTRAIDCDGKADLFKGTQVAVANGTAYGSQVFMVTTADPITVGVTSLAFANSSFSATSYVKKDGTTPITGAQAFQSTSSFTTAGGLLRWLFGRVTAETGSGNTGSDLRLDAYADDGTTIIGYAWKVIRSSRVVDFFALPTIGGATLASSLPAFVASGASHAKGLVPDPGASAGTAKFLCEDATFKAVPAPDGIFRALKILVTSTSAITMTADMVSVWDTSFGVQNLRAFNQAISTAASGAGGIDSGAVGANSWYAVWAIAKADGTMAAMLSLSATAPTMPSGYTYKARMGWVRTDGSSNLYFTIQYGRRAQYIVGTNPTTMRSMATGALGSVTVPTWSAVSVSNFVPTTALQILATLTSTGASMMAAPNNTYGVYNSTTNPPPVVASSAGTYATAFSMMLESTNIYYASNSTGTLWCTGWEDNL